jgi:hypothetical protein
MWKVLVRRSSLPSQQCLRQRWNGVIARRLLVVARTCGIRIARESEASKVSQFSSISKAETGGVTNESAVAHSLVLLLYRYLQGKLKNYNTSSITTLHKMKVHYSRHLYITLPLTKSV